MALSSEKPTAESVATTPTMSTPVTITPKGGYFDSSCARRVHLEHDAAYADSELEPIPAADQARMDAGHVREALVAEMWADALEFNQASAKMLGVAEDVSLPFKKKVTKISSMLDGVQAFAVPSCDRTTQASRWCGTPDCHRQGCASPSRTSSSAPGTRPSRTASGRTVPAT